MSDISQVFAVNDIFTFWQAIAGTRKLVNIPWGFKKRVVRVIVPSGVKEGSKLRLKGLGKIAPDGQGGFVFESGHSRYFMKYPKYSLLDTDSLTKLYCLTEQSSQIV